MRENVKFVNQMCVACIFHIYNFQYFEIIVRQNFMSWWNYWKKRLNNNFHWYTGIQVIGQNTNISQIKIKPMNWCTSTQNIITEIYWSICTIICNEFSLSIEMVVPDLTSINGLYAYEIHHPITAFPSISLRISSMFFS